MLALLIPALQSGPTLIFTFKAKARLSSAASRPYASPGPREAFAECGIGAQPVWTEQEPQEMVGPKPQIAKKKKTCNDKCNNL
jgi:hypothetical protein